MATLDFPGNEFKRSHCPLANLLDLFGDKWSLLVVRDLFLGKSRFQDFIRSRENIPTNILAQRLKLLEAAGIVEKSAYCFKPLRYQYRLTAKGKDLLPVLDAMRAWANAHIEGVQVFPRFERDPEQP